MKYLALLFALLVGGSALAQQVPRDPTAGNISGVPIAAVFSGADTSTQSVVLAAATGKVTYICGFYVSGLGATAATTISVTVATLASATTMTFQYSMPLGATVQSTPLSVHFTMCLPASATGAAITITVPGAAGNTATQINAWGFQL